MKSLLTVFVVVVVAFVVAGCGGSSASEQRWGLESEDIARQVPITLPGPGVEAQELTLRIVGSGAGAAHVDEEVFPANVAVRPDLPVTVTILNYTGVAHTFHSPELGLAKIVLAGTERSPGKMSFSFTPGRKDVFHWRCLLCPEGMEGKVYAIMGV